MSKLRYLTGNGEHRKLKRNVPPELRSIAKKWAWVQRVAGKSAEDVRRLQQLFALSTEAEISHLKKQKASSGVVTGGPISLNLDETAAKRLAVVYFNQMDEINRREGAYTVDPGHPAYQDVLQDAAADYAHARAATIHAELGTSRTAIQLLIDKGYLPVDLPRDARGNYQLPSEVGKHASFQLLCRGIEWADLELADRRCQAVYHGKTPPAGDGFFAINDRTSINSIST